MTIRSQAFALAEKLGVTLEVRRKRHVFEVDIYLPKGWCYDGNRGLDALHHECEHGEDIWPYVLADLNAVGPEEAA